MHIFKSLSGCVNDAHAVKAILERHADGTVNFVTPRILTGTGSADVVERSELKDAVRELFAGDAEIALLYFAGHGYLEDTGGFLCAGDCKTGDDGFSLAELMTLASKSNARNKVIILDSCHGGIAGDRPTAQGVAEIKRRHDDSDGLNGGTVCNGSSGWRRRRFHHLIGRRPRRRCRELGRGCHARKRICPHRSVAWPLGATSCIQDKCEVVRISSEGHSTNSASGSSSSRNTFSSMPVTTLNWIRHTNQSVLKSSGTIQTFHLQILRKLPFLPFCRSM